MARTILVAIAASWGASCADESVLEPREGLLRGHAEIRAGEDGAFLPTYLVEPGATAVELSICTDGGERSEHWSAEFRIGSEEGWLYTANPSRRATERVCFSRAVPIDRIRRLHPNPSELGPFDLCVRVSDELGPIADLGCHRARVAEQEGYAALRGQLLQNVWLRAHGESVEDPAGSESAIGPLLRDRLDLVGAVVLINSREPEALDEAIALFDRMRRQAHFDDPAATEMSGLVLRELARALVERGDRRAAWRESESADQRLRRTASEHRISVADVQTRIVGDEGAVRFGIERFGRALAECDEPLVLCNESYIQDVEANYAWLVTRDPMASADELADAEARFRETVESKRRREAERGLDPEVVNQSINVAHALQLSATASGRPTSPRELDAKLDEALRTLEERRHLLGPGGDRERFLRGWIEWIRLRDRLQRERGELVTSRDPAAIADIETACRAIGSRYAASDPGLGALGALCAGEAAILPSGPSRSPSWERAVADFDHAATLLDGASPAELGVPMGPSPRADADYWTALAQVGLDRPSDAWATLAQLDRRIDANCPSSEDPALELRIFWVDDRVVLLHRRQGEVSAHSVPLPRGELIEATRAVRALRSAPSEATAERRRWDRALSPIADALYEGTPDEPDRVIEAAVYGALHDLPLDAIRLSSAVEPARAGGNQVGQHRLLAFRPACSSAAEALEGPAERLLFALDPGGDLEGSRSLAAFVRRELDGAEVLEGSDVSVEALRGALGAAGSLHIDTHGRYDGAFPGYSVLELADGRWTIDDVVRGELAGAPAPFTLTFANLSACQTGRSPTSAGSGMYGFGGAFARRGVRWVIASSGEIEDRIAAEFNERFYPTLLAERDVPRAYAVAIRQLRSRYPESPERWMVLQLLASGRGFADVKSPIADSSTS